MSCNTCNNGNNGYIGNCAWDCNGGDLNCGGPCWNGVPSTIGNGYGCGLCALGAFPNQCNAGFYDDVYDTCACPYGYAWNGANQRTCCGVDCGSACYGIAGDVYSGSRGYGSGPWIGSTPHVRAQSFNFGDCGCCAIKCGAGDCVGGDCGNNNVAACGYRPKVCPGQNCCDGFGANWNVCNANNGLGPGTVGGGGLASNRGPGGRCGQCNIGCGAGAVAAADNGGGILGTGNGSCACEDQGCGGNGTRIRCGDNGCGGFTGSGGCAAGTGMGNALNACGNTVTRRQHFGGNTPCAPNTNCCRGPAPCGQDGVCGQCCN